MREEYIKLIKEHILSNPDYKYTINELKATLISYGVTEEEFEEAIQQMAGPTLQTMPKAPPQPDPAIIAATNAATNNKAEIDEAKDEITSVKQELSETKEELNTGFQQLSEQIRQSTTQNKDNVSQQHPQPIVQVLQPVRKDDNKAEFKKTEEEMVAIKKELRDDLKETKQDIEKNLQQLAQEVKKSSEKNKNNYVMPSDTSPVVKQPSSFKRLMVLDVASHVTMILFIIIAGVVLSSWVFLNKFTVPQSATDYELLSKTKIQNGIVAKVYATGKAIDAQRVFSYPPSNVTLTATGTPSKEVLGFFPYWMLDVQDKITLSGLTTVALFGLDTDANGNIITINHDGSANGGWDMWNNPKLNVFLNRTRARRVKVVLTMKCFSNDDMERLVTSDTAQKTFISNVIQLINAKSLDGVNIDFEYVGTPDPKITTGFTRLMTNLNTDLKREAPNATLTIDTYINSAAIPGIFDIPTLSHIVDAFVIMGYDMHTPSGDPGPVAPMEGDVSIIGLMQSYLEEVAPEKLILAVPYYGYDWPVGQAANPDNVQIVPYAEIVATSKSSTIEWDDIAQTPWYQYIDPLTNKKREVHFENTRSLGVKFDYVNRKNLKGIGIWALGYDGTNADFHELILEKFAK